MRYVILIVLINVLALVSNVKNVESDTSTVPYYIYNAATKFKIDVALLYAFCRVESNCRAKAINHDDGTAAQKAAGIVDKSYGLFQLKLSTVKGLGFQQIEHIKIVKKTKNKTVTIRKAVDHTKDLLNPEVSTWYAAKLISQLYKRYGDTPKVISAYNAGRYTTANEEYVMRVLKAYTRYKIDKRF